MTPETAARRALVHRLIAEYGASIHRIRRVGVARLEAMTPEQQRIALTPKKQLGRKLGSRNKVHKVPEPKYRRKPTPERLMAIANRLYELRSRRQG